MLGNYFKIAWRNLARNKGYAFINIAGLAVALAVFMVIVFYIRHETSYDRHLPESDQTYRVLMSDTQTGNTHAGSPPGLPRHMMETFPEVARGAKVNFSSSPVLYEYENRQVYETNGLGASREFFHIFQYDFIYGSRDGGLTEPYSLVLTRSLSERLFGEEDPVGQTVVRGKNNEYTVTGVVEDPPSNTSLRFTAVFHYPELSMDQWENSWSISTGNTYLLLNESSVASLREKLPGYVQTHGRFSDHINKENRSIILQPLSDVYLYPEGRQSGSDKLVYIRIFLAAALLILLIASVNYVNLATARSLERAREIGVRKAVGASRWQVIQQVMAETFLTCGISFLLAIVFVELALPNIQQWYGLDLSGMSWMNAEGVLILASLLAGIALLSGVYCAFYLSSFNPRDVFQGQAGGKPRKTWVRKGLVVAQFAVSAIVIISTVLMARQMEFIRESRMNGEDARVLVVHNSSETINEQFDAFRQSLLQHASVEKVAAGVDVGGYTMTMSLAENEKDIPNVLRAVSGTYDYLEALGQDLVSGRYLTEEIAGDSTNNVLLNETAAQLFDVEEAKGQHVPKPVDANVVGIVEDYHDRSFYQRVEPTIIRYEDGNYVKRNIYVRFRADRISEGLERVRETWASFQTGYPFDYTFLDQELDSQYRAELRMASVFRGFAGFSILIACLGLFGLAAFAARRRTKEIGIRKVLGATVSNIVSLLSREFLLLVGLGFLVAVPVAYYGVSRWLQEFAYRIDMGAWPFLAVGAAVLLIALLTVSGQSLRAARSNPADSLRTE